MTARTVVVRQHHSQGCTGHIETSICEVSVQSCDHELRNSCFVDLIDVFGWVMGGRQVAGVSQETWVGVAAASYLLPLSSPIS